jgi:FHS family L-fucose permease-like MFS transporter
MLFGPCWPTIYAETLGVVKEKKYTEMAGAILVMSIVGGAFIPAAQGYVSDLFHSMQIFLVPMACFIYVGFYFFSKTKQQQAAETLTEESEKIA